MKEEPESKAGIKGAKSLNITLIAIVAIVVIGLVAAVYLLKGGAVNEEKTITTTGNAEMSVMPDYVVISLLVETEDKSAEESKALNSVIYGRVLSEITNKIGIKNNEIETESYTISPDYEWINNVQRLKGYKVSNYFIIKTYNFKENVYKAQVLANASEDAKSKAAAIASGAGKKLGDLVSIDTSDYNYMPYPLVKAGATAEEAKQATTSISPKNLDISATISAVYTIE
jgi:uncharacterized protein YggE